VGPGDRSDDRGVETGALLEAVQSFVVTVVTDPDLRLQEDLGSVKHRLSCHSAERKVIKV